MSATNRTMYDGIHRDVVVGTRPMNTGFYTAGDLLDEIERLRRIEQAAKRIATPQVMEWADDYDTPKTLWQAIVYLADVLDDTENREEMPS